MNKKELHNAVFEAYALSIRASAFELEDIKLSTYWCLDRHDMEVFVSFLEEKIPEDFTFLKDKRYEIVQDVCSEIEYYFPVEDDEKTTVVAKSKLPLNSQSVVDKQRN